MADGQGYALGSSSIPGAAALPGFGIPIQTFQVYETFSEEKISKRTKVLMANCIECQLIFCEEYHILNMNKVLTQF